MFSACKIGLSPFPHPHPSSFSLLEQHSGKAIVLPPASAVALAAALYSNVKVLH